MALETFPDTWDRLESRHDHPSFLMALGQLPGDGVDHGVMHRTLDATLPGTSAYLQTPCGALAGDMSTASAAVVSDCGLTLWQHRAAP